jgi:NADPH:quinone reductase-like Zn-dependent oxidoreductase
MHHIMKAIIFKKYGSPDLLKLEEISKPVPRQNEVLVNIQAASINSWDWELLHGTPFANRLMFGLFQPRIRILGADIAGRIEAIGKNITRFQPGDEVFGDLSSCDWGGFAEYVAARENALTLKPDDMTFEEAAAIPQAGLLALQGLYNKGRIQPGHRVLINGAGGGAGTFAIQIARSLGAAVTGVDSTIKLDIMKSIGADHVIDYTKEDFTQNGLLYDWILDFASHHSISDYHRSLNPGGTCVIAGGSGTHISQVILFGPLISKITGKKISVLMHKTNKDLSIMGELFTAGKIRPVIDKCYPLNEVPEALRYFGIGNARGKVIITI